MPALRDVTADDLDAALERLDDEELRRYVRHVVTEDARVLSVVRLLDERAARRHRTAADRVARARCVTTSGSPCRRSTLPSTRCSAAGALGARMTGGGFGGCVIGLVPERVVGRGG